ncbi:hypothetical protein COB55_03130 [Candidatus Wolfebacteria bacterium]|nr:MAG: hypothetical protein COB55_03130 [Candidatus Wolfebacteria bacterium]
MIITVTEQIFIQAFKSLRPDNFSIPALKILFKYYDDFDYESEVELDVIRLCCEWSELSGKEIMELFDMNFLELSDNTAVIEVDEDIFLVQEF